MEEEELELELEARDGMGGSAAAALGGTHVDTRSVRMFAPFQMSLSVRGVVEGWKGVSVAMVVLGIVKVISKPWVLVPPWALRHAVEELLSLWPSLVVLVVSTQLWQQVVGVEPCEELEKQMPLGLMMGLQMLTSMTMMLMMMLPVILLMPFPRLLLCLMLLGAMMLQKSVQMFLFPTRHHLVHVPGEHLATTSWTPRQPLWEGCQQKRSRCACFVDPHLELDKANICSVSELRQHLPGLGL